jgi:hypothetical protein
VAEGDPGCTVNTPGTESAALLDDTETPAPPWARGPDGEPPSVAERVSGTPPLNGSATAVKVADDIPPATVTVPGKDKAPELSLNETMAPPEGAADPSVTVHVVEALDAIVDGLQLKDDTTGPLPPLDPLTVPDTGRAAQVYESVHLSDLPARVAKGPDVAFSAYTITGGKPTVHCTDAGSEPGGETSVRFAVRLLEELLTIDRVNVALTSELRAPRSGTRAQHGFSEPAGRRWFGRSTFSFIAGLVLSSARFMASQTESRARQENTNK